MKAHQAVELPPVAGLAKPLLVLLAKWLLVLSAQS
jgi:hypothetical protein